jgi:hypothetical protein
MNPQAVKLVLCGGSLRMSHSTQDVIAAEAAIQMFLNSWIPGGASCRQLARNAIKTAVECQHSTKQCESRRVEFFVDVS